MPRKLKVCTGPSCCRNHATEILKKARKSAITTKTEISESNCMGFCPNAPCINLNNKIFTNVNPGEINQLLGDQSTKNTQSNPNLDDAQFESIDDLLNP